MIRKYAITCLVGASIAASLPLLAHEAERTETRSYTKPNGNSVTIEKKETLDEVGVSSSRRFHVTDSDGDAVAAGRDHEWKNRDGREGASQAAVRYDEQGNRVVKGRQRQEDGDGNSRTRKGKSVQDDAGDVVAKGMNGSSHKDGVDRKVQKRQHTGADGSTTTSVRRGKIDAAGNKTTVERTRTEPSPGGAGARHDSGEAEAENL